MSETWVLDFIAAKCRLKDPSYMGVDLWPMFQILCARMRIVPITTETAFADTYIARYSVMSNLEAIQFLNIRLIMSKQQFIQAVLEKVEKDAAGPLIRDGERIVEICFKCARENYDLIKGEISTMNISYDDHCEICDKPQFTRTTRKVIM